MPRKQALSKEEKDVCQRIKELRTALGVPVTNFAALMGFSLAKLINREQGITPWKEGEIALVKRRAAEHVNAETKALAALDA